MKNMSLLEEFIKEAIFLENKYPSQYKAKGKRKKKLDTATKLAKSDSEADRQRAYKMRDNMEKAERNKKGWKNVPRHDTKK